MLSFFTDAFNYVVNKISQWFKMGDFEARNLVTITDNLVVCCVIAIWFPATGVILAILAVVQYFYFLIKYVDQMENAICLENWQVVA